MNQRIATIPVDQEVNRKARERALAASSWPVNLAASSVGYQSHGHVLAIGDSRALTALLDRQGDSSSLASLTLVVTDAGHQALTTHADLRAHADLRVFVQPLLGKHPADLHLEGYLGNFRLWLPTPDGPINLAKALLERDGHDLVIDLCAEPSLPRELPPPGYFHAPVAGEQRDTLIDGLADWVGDFEKPRYFQIHNDRCAHSTRGFEGCTRCLEVCPADAIHSVPGRIGAHIEIDPQLCQGVGSCSSACPTGAIEFRQPHSLRQQDTLLAWLDGYHNAGGTSPVVRFVQADYTDHQQPDAPHVIDVALEDLGAAGADHWLSLIAAGACEVRIVDYPSMPPRLAAHLEDQLAQARGLLAALGHSEQRLQRFAASDPLSSDALPRHAGLPTRLSRLDDDADSDGDDEQGKRRRLNRVLEHLALHGEQDGQRHSMPGGSPFGGIDVNSDACTLCMGCVASCPTDALAAGGDTPRLDFREADCVQCGLCAKSCPESAITLQPGFFASSARADWRVCHEDSPFHCISCGTAFANRGTIEAIQQKLAQHPYFSGDQARRLEMCQDCRVKDVWQEMATNPEAQLKV
ncbi:4Fe-4S binding protein [Halomonas denitrificans]|uniref:4Fe-4S binding protein n=1 Tax=Halomonas TaxID=2745 RepID=UPI001C970DBD|nr:MULTISPECIES: 4Fe-4S binding protein [Halomonas]MBY5927647.1 4Fe-4S binding protein [Halomonas sp. DP8Y7-3]MBY6029691.1 4Fe-4S binding protein [Halomonas sp. DP8Y7-1]MCA0973608.1 4Fe-4S binding protein [Halomonas denitrificans]MED5294407.1 4Fe-4S binding protein [Pseudomonadota bacterium]